MGWFLRKLFPKKVEPPLQDEAPDLLPLPIRDEDAESVASSIHINSDKIYALVDELLKNEKINSPYIPDFIERKIYANCMLLLLRLIDRIIEGANINILGHELRLSLRPCEEEVV